MNYETYGREQGKSMVDNKRKKPEKKKTTKYNNAEMRFEFSLEEKTNAIAYILLIP